MPKYKLPNGKTIFSETELTPDELDELASEGEPEFEPIKDVPFKAEPIPVVPIVPEIPEQPPTEESGFLSQVWDAINKPLMDVQQPENEHPHARTARLASQMLTPLNIGSAALTGGSSALAGALPQIARTLGMGARGLSGLTAAHGGIDVATEDTLTGKGMGMLELIGGMLGMKQGLPKIGKSIASGELPPISTSQAKIQSPWDEIPNIDTKPPVVKSLIPETPPAIPKLPQGLQGARPTYNMGSSKYVPKFESDLDKALYIIAQKNPSKQDAQYLEFVMKHTGLDKAGARAAGVKLRGQLKDIIKKSEPGDVQISQLYTPTTPTKPVLRLDTKRGVYVDKATGEEIPLNDTRLRKTENVEIPPNEKISPEVTVKLPEPPKDGTILQKSLNFPRSIQAAYDISYPFRQGIGLIHTKGWWNSWDDMIKSYGSEDAYKAVMESIESKPNYQRITDAATGKVKPSFAEEAGLNIGSLDDIAKREEAMISNWAEKIPGVRASNRAYSAFANKLRSDNFDALVELAEKTSKGEPSLNPRTNLVLAKSIANFVNNASGRGNLGSLEKAAVELNGLFFSPRLIASRLQYMNPNNYIHGDPLVRKEYLKSLIAMGIAWTSMAGLAKMAGADVSLDSTSADFGKIRIGNTRLDPAGGFQQYIVLASRLVNQGRTNSASDKNKNPKFQNYGEGYKAPTFGEDLTKFIRNKLAPIPSYVSDPFFASEKYPFEVGDRTIRLFAPIVSQDLSELAQEDPMLIPGIIPSAVGLGIQNYGDREPGRFLPESIFPRKSDFRFPLDRRR